VKIEYRDSNDPLVKLLGKGNPVLVVGLGNSGISTANLLARMGCAVEVSEKSKREDTMVDMSRLQSSVTVHWGGHPEELFTRFPLVIVSPGVPGDLRVLHVAFEKGAKIIGEMELAFRLTTAPWVAVTGSNGKSTTVTLVDLMAQEHGLLVSTGGNLGTPVTSFVGQDENPEFIVAEVSSFQLETVDQFRPNIAAMLNLSPDHLDRHADVEEYVAAKMRIFSRMTEDDWAVLNEDDRWISLDTRALKVKRFPFSRKHILDQGAFVKEGWIILREGVNESPVAAVSSLALAGNHNLENALAASAIACRMGIDRGVITKVLTSFAGLEHRMELLGYFRGVPVYNDSKGTNVGATVRSLEGLGGQVILILGGRDKGTSYEPLKKMISKKVDHLILLGESAPRMQKAFNGASRIITVDSLDEAVRVAVQYARPGSEILFSPACSSFDMFSGFEERGLAFKEAARKYMGLAR
jgi:UDP-N-acetylmuramoylalanine--D-glutamate ligase